MTRPNQYLLDTRSFSIAWFFAHLVYGRLLAPILIANALGMAWCMYKGWHGFIAFITFA